MSFIHDFPHTNIYDKDLGWLIRQYKELNDNYEVLKDIYNIVKNQIHDVTLTQLKEWLDDGTLEHIIEKDLNLYKIYQNTQMMVNDVSLIDGVKVKTLGYYDFNDGGGATFLIRKTADSSPLKVKLNNGLYAILELEHNTLNVKQLGVKAETNFNTTTILQEVINNCPKDVTLLIPSASEHYNVNNIVINDFMNVKIEGTIRTFNKHEVVLISNNHKTQRCMNIYVHDVLNGILQFKGQQSAIIKVDSADVMEIVADSINPGNYAFAFNQLLLGFIGKLYLYDDGTDTKYINENTFVGGRFETLEIGTRNSRYEHQNNTFIKPLCESTTINFNYARENFILDARLEGTVNITMDTNARFNYINSNYTGGNVNNGFATHNDFKLANIKTLVDKTGLNNFYRNFNLNEWDYCINASNNPKKITVNQQGQLTANNDQVIFSTDKIEVPKDPFALTIECDSAVRFRITPYNQQGNEISNEPSFFITKNNLSWDSVHSYWDCIAGDSAIYIIEGSRENPYPALMEIEFLGVDNHTTFRKLNYSLTSYKNDTTILSLSNSL